MFLTMQTLIPQEWSSTVELLSAPVSWLPAWHVTMINFAWGGVSFAEILLKRALVLMPMLLVIVAVWCTMVSLYTLPFRSGRGGFLTAMLRGWWDVGRAIWFFWAGMVRVAMVLVGWVKASIGLVLAMLKSFFMAPLEFLDWTSRSYFKPGVPWVAFLGLLIWSGAEASM